MELRVKKPRVFSAKYSPAHKEKVRPFSGVSTQTYKRQQIIENVYTSQSHHPARGVSAKNQPMGRYYSSHGDSDKKIFRPVLKQTRQKEEMAQEILVLKQTIHKLSEELSHQRGKVQTMKRKNSKYSKVLTMEFQNEKQWNNQSGSSHLVAGIKAMYDSLKEKYEKKCLDSQRILMKLETTNYLEMKHYIQIVEKKNHELNRKLEIMMSDNMQFSVSSQDQKKAASFMASELKFENEKLSQKYKEVSVELKRNVGENKDLDKKIMFLEKLMIEKDNSIYRFQRKTKEAVNQTRRIKEECQEINKQYLNLRQDYEKEVDLSQTRLKQTNFECSVKIAQIKDKNDQTVSTLDKSNSYYQQSIIELRKSNVQLNLDLQKLKEEKWKMSLQDKSRVFEPKQQLHQKQTDRLELKTHHSPLTSNTDRKRQPQRADQKHSEDASKRRKIQLSEILQIAELIRFKIIAKKLSLDQFKDLFSVNPDRDYSDLEWSEEYITMQEAIDILSNEPIHLQGEPAFHLARYIIEDINEEYVYCDQMNENHREVVKSILNNLVPDCPDHKHSNIDAECNRIIEQYGQNLQGTLATLHPSGLISRVKFQTILKSLGIEISQLPLEYLIGKMALKSNDINELPFQLLFQ